MKIKNWIVASKDGKWGAVVDNHVDTKKRLIKLGWKIMGEPLFKDKADAIEWVKSCKR